MLPPNILLILTDQQRHDTVAALGNAVIRTPALDRLAHEGAAFTRCYTPSPVCVAARASLCTGMPPHRSGCVDNDSAVDPARPSFMQTLADAGYQTHGVGKMHFTPDPLRPWGFESRDVSEEGAGPADAFRAFLAERGFAHVDEPHGARSEYYYLPQPSQLPERLHPTRWTADRSIDFLRRRDRDRPFFLWTSFIKPHPPFESPTPWHRLYRAVDVASPFRPDGHADLLGYWNHAQNRFKYRDAGHDDLLLRTMKAAYYACISYVDRQVARLLDALGDEIDRTLLVFTSDHGELLGDYGSVGKRCMLDPAVRVPMLVRWPAAFAAGARCDTPCSLTDLWPTFTAAAGLDRPAPSDEAVALQRLAGGAAADRVVFSQFQRGGYGLYMAASRDAKYVYSAPDRREWVFDRRDDTPERFDAGDTLALTRDDLRRRCVERFRRDGYEEPLDGDGWRVFPRRAVPHDPDDGLLFQDPPGLQDRIDALGEGYRRVVTRPPEVGLKLLRAHSQQPSVP